jgi:hypothetical protein
MKYKVFYYQGNELSLKTRVTRADCWLDDAGLHIDGPIGFTIPAADLLAVELFRLHGLGRVIRVEHRGGRLFLSVVRFMIGQFALINFLRTGELHRRLADVVKPSLG